MLSSAGIGALAFIIALVLRHYGKGRKAVLPLFLIAGLGLTGVLGSVLERGGPALSAAFGAVTAWGLGVGIPIALAIVMGISVWHHAQSGSTGKLACVTAVLFFPVCAAVGGIGAWLATSASQLLGQVGPTASQFLNGLGAA